MDSFNWKVLTLLTGKEIFTLVSLTVDNITIENIKGVITFPENNEGPFRIELNLIPEQRKLFSDAYETSESYSLVRIEAFGSNEKYISDKLFIKKYNLSPSIYGEYNILIYAYEVKRIVSLPEPGTSHSKITFWLNDNAYIPENSWLDKHYDGNVIVKAAPEEYTTLKVSDELTFKFKKTYIYQNNENGYSARRYKVCEVVTKNEITNQKNVDDIIGKLENFLLLVSFGYGNRVTWIGYEYSDSYNYYDFYRETIKRTHKSNRNDWIDKNGYVVNDFIIQSFNKFNENNNYYIAIKNAIYALCNDNDNGIIDAKYLELFSAFESILLAYNKKTDSEKLLTNRKFDKLRTEMEVGLKDYFVRNKLDDNIKTKMIEKISELNRPSLRNTLERFQEAFSLHLDNLWPIFAEGVNKPGLADIRNKLIHGDFLYRKYDYLDFAKHQLRLILTITIIKVLGWPIEKTQYTDDYIKRLCYYFPDKLEAARENWKLNLEEII